MATKNESFADFVASQKFISGEWYLIPYEGKIFNKKHREVTGCPYQDGDNKRYVIGTKWHGITTHIIKSRAIWIGAHGGVVPNPELQIDHIDGDTSNDCIDNLRLTTQSQNMGNLATLHKRLGEGNSNAKLTEDDVREIRSAMENSGNSPKIRKRICEKFHVCEQTIRDIETGKSWC